MTIFKSNPIVITLNNINTISDTYYIGSDTIGNKIFPILEGVFDGATVKIQLQGSNGWVDLHHRQDATVSDILLYSHVNTGDNIEMTFGEKFRFVCLNPSSNTNIVISVRY